MPEPSCWDIFHLQAAAAGVLLPGMADGEQRTDAWHNLRDSRLTASAFSNALGYVLAQTRSIICQVMLRSLQAEAAQRSNRKAGAANVGSAVLWHQWPLPCMAMALPQSKHRWFCHS